MTPTRTWVILFNVFNVLDAATTIFGIKMKLVHELNPAMGILLNISPLLFIAVKCGLIGTWVSYGCIVGDSRKLARFMAFFFMTIVIWNLVHITLAATR